MEEIIALIGESLDGLFEIAYDFLKECKTRPSRIIALISGVALLLVLPIAFIVVAIIGGFPLFDYWCFYALVALGVLSILLYVIGFREYLLRENKKVGLHLWIGVAICITASLIIGSIWVNTGAK